MELNLTRFEDTKRVTIQPAELNIESLSGKTQAERNKILKERERRFQEVWARHNDDYKKAINDKDIDDANRIWCLAAETFLWELQTTGKELPKDKPRRGLV